MIDVFECGNKIKKSVLILSIFGGVSLLSGCSSFSNHLTSNESLALLKNELLKIQTSDHFDARGIKKDSFISSEQVHAIFNDDNENSYITKDLIISEFEYNKLVAMAKFKVQNDWFVSLAYYINSEKQGCFQYVKSVTYTKEPTDIFTTNIDVNISTYCSPDLTNVVGLRTEVYKDYQYQSIAF